MRRVAVRFLASTIVICITYGILSDYGTTQSILKKHLLQKEHLLVKEMSLPSSMLHGSEEQVYLPLGEDESKSTLEHERTRLLEANGPLRGSERQVSTQAGEREDVSNEVHTLVQDGASEQSGAAIISFIIPSTLARATLNRTIESLQNQTRSNWEAIVGVDLAISNLTEKQVASGSLIFMQDRRVRYVPINTVGTNRGQKGNGAGEIRNQIIRNYATSKWVAFVDDDDTLSPDYIEHWETGRQHEQSADVIIFRMESLKRIIPPLAHGSIARKNSVGISFAVRKELFVRKQNGIAFVPNKAEDYNFLKLAQTCKATILISTDCVTYFVRQRPLLSRHQTSCRFENATIAVTPPRKKRLHPQKNVTKFL
jgi:hypothetical protein